MEGVGQAEKKPNEVDIAAYMSFSVHEDIKKATRASPSFIPLYVTSQTPTPTLKENLMKTCVSINEGKIITVVPV